MGTRRVTCLLLAALAGVCGLLVPAAAALDPEPVSHVFRLEDSNGYSLYVHAFSEESDGRGEVVIAARRKNAGAAYRAIGTVTGDGVRADFGAIGTIDVVLNRSGRLKKFRRKCWRAELYEPGTYEGTIRFDGEGGYARARQTQAPLVPLPLGPACGSGSSESRGDGLPGARLRGISYAHGRKLEFQLNKNHPRGRTKFEVALRERRDGIEIARNVAGFAPSSAFDYDPDLRTARLSPPPPFSGMASLSRSRHSVSPIWTGNLEVDLPGRPGLRLAGPAVYVSLVHACFAIFDRPEAKSC